LAGCVARKAHLKARSFPQFYGSAVDKLRGLADRLLIVRHSITVAGAVTCPSVVVT
jgi:hypothetical protein